MADGMTDPGQPPQWADSWFGLRVSWTGQDGSEWDLSDPSGGVALLMDGVEGLHFPKVTRYTSKSRVVPGHRLRGWQAEPRDVFWHLWVWADGSQVWLDRQAAFFRTIHPSNPGMWRVEAAGRARSLQLTGVFDSPYTYQVDPVRRGWALYPVALEAAAPYWEGEPATYGPWRVTGGVPFIPAGGAPPFQRSSFMSTSQAVVANPGDVDVWPVWRVTGPLTDVRLGIAGSLIVVPFALTAGQELVIDTDPRRPTATRNGIDVTAQLGLQSYAQVPSGQQVPITVTVTGSGGVSCTITPLYFRAF